MWRLYHKLDAAVLRVMESRRPEDRRSAEWDEGQKRKVTLGLDRLETEAPEEIAFMHINMNSITAGIGALERLFDRMPPRGIVILNDYGHGALAIQKEVKDVFMAMRGHAILELPTGQGLVIKR